MASAPLAPQHPAGLASFRAAFDRARRIGRAVHSQLGSVHFFDACKGWDSAEEGDTILRNSIFVDSSGDAWVAHGDPTETNEDGSVVVIVRGAGQPRADGDDAWVKAMSCIVPAALGDFAQRQCPGAAFSDYAFTATPVWDGDRVASIAVRGEAGSSVEG